MTLQCAGATIIIIAVAVMNMHAERTHKNVMPL